MTLEYSVNTSVDSYIWQYVRDSARNYAFNWVSNSIYNCVAKGINEPVWHSVLVIFNPTNDLSKDIINSYDT